MGSVAIGSGGVVGSVVRDATVLDGGSRLIGHMCRLSGLVVGLGHGVNNLVHLRSALRGLNLLLTGVLRGTRVDVGEVTLNSVVVLIVLIHIAVDIDVSGSREGAATVVSGRTSNSGTATNASLGGRRVSTAAKGDASSRRSVVVVFQLGELVVECGVGLIVRLVARAVVRSVVRLRVVLSVGLRVVLEVRLGVRLVVRFRVRLIVRLGVRLIVRLRVRLEVIFRVGLEVRLSAAREATATKSDGTGGGAIVVILQRSDLML